MNFRSADNQISYRYISAAILSLSCDIFGQIRDAKQLPIQIDLPAELEECAISALLAFAHGEELVCEGDDKLSFFYIAAKYLGFKTPLVGHILSKVRASKIKQPKRHEMDSFVHRLIPPRFHLKYKAIKDPTELPYKK